MLARVPSLHENVAALIGEYAKGERPDLIAQLDDVEHVIGEGRQALLFEFVRLREVMIAAASEMESVVDQL